MARKEKKPFERKMLQQISEKDYIKKIENTIVEQGVALLHSINKSFLIISSKDISKFLEAHPDLKHPTRGYPTWYQIGLRKLYDTKQISCHQYHLLIRMKQVLNKNGKYLLRPKEFDDKLFVSKCEYYKRTDLCYRDDCVANFSCTLYWKYNKEKEEEKEIDEK